MPNNKFAFVFFLQSSVLFISFRLHVKMKYLKALIIFLFVVFKCWHFHRNDNQLRNSFSRFAFLATSAVFHEDLRDSSAFHSSSMNPVVNRLFSFRTFDTFAVGKCSPIKIHRVYLRKRRRIGKSISFIFKLIEGVERPWPVPTWRKWFV